jgi:hypothetical protein
MLVQLEWMSRFVVAFIWLSLKDDPVRIVSLRIDDVHWLKNTPSRRSTLTMTTTLDIALPHHAIAIAPFHCVNRTPFAPKIVQHFRLRLLGDVRRALSRERAIIVVYLCELKILIDRILVFTKKTKGKISTSQQDFTNLAACRQQQLPTTNNQLKTKPPTMDFY